jgi:hypothetical protein
MTMSLPPPLDAETTAKLQHPTLKKLPVLVVAFYQDLEVETFAPEAVTGTERVPAVRSSDIFLTTFLGSNQLTVAYSEDTAVKPAKAGLGIWYTSGGQYKCRTYVADKV